MLHPCLILFHMCPASVFCFFGFSRGFFSFTSVNLPPISQPLQFLSSYYTAHVSAAAAANAYTPAAAAPADADANANAATGMDNGSTKNSPAFLFNMFPFSASAAWITSSSLGRKRNFGLRHWCKPPVEPTLENNIVLKQHKKTTSFLWQP